MLKYYYNTEKKRKRSTKQMVAQIDKTFQELISRGENRKCRDAGVNANEQTTSPRTPK